jgi:bacillithiol biosynthesis cysteine-adding enzyme BshC
VTVELLPTPIAPLPAIAWHDRAAERERPIAAALHAACLAEGTAERQLDRLFAPRALCVTTGQQPGLFLGPLFTVYKAMSAVALAARLEHLLGRPVVPVFWVAGDDHDHAEACQTHLLTTTYDVLRLALPERPPQAPLTPMYRERLGPTIADLVETARRAAPPSEFRDDVLGWIGRHYTPEADVAGAFAGALAELLGPFGLVVFRPTHAAAKTAMRPLLLEALAQAGHLDRALAVRAEELRARGAAAPIATGDGATTIMVEGAAGRDRLLFRDGTFQTRRSAQQFTLDELRVLADRAPERFSPNVLLRPVVEAALLPTLAYLGGAGELAYLPQAAPLYDALGVPPQVPAPRWSGTVVEARVRKVLEKYALQPSDLQPPEGPLEQRLVRGDMPESAVAALQALREAVPREYTRLREGAISIDPTLRRPVESAQHAALTGLQDIEKRILAHLKQQNDILVQQLAKARRSLYPLDRPQERVLSIVSHLVRYGPPFLAALHGAAEGWAAALEPGRRGV